MTDFIESLNLINSEKIHELYSSQKTEDPLVLRKKAADFRKGYKNWRQKKPKGARGETNYLTDSQKLHASEHVDNEQLIMKDAKAEQEEEANQEGPRKRGSSTSRRLDSIDSGLGLGEGRGSLARHNSFSSKPDAGQLREHADSENWLRFYVNPYSGMAEAITKEPLPLSQANLKKLPYSVVRPKFLRPEGEAYVDNYICHLGVGGFHRSHEAVYTDDLLNLGTTPKWGIVGVGLMPWDKKMYDILKKQNYLYTLLSRGHTGSEARVIGSIVDFVFAPEGHQAAIDRLADPSTKIVSLTVTEKGYCQNVKGDLDQENQMVKDDLTGNLEKPKTAIGMIVAALRARRDRKVPSFTVMSCDNLPENGDKAKHVVLQMAGLVEPELEAWIKTNTTFPNTMVDRITPMTEQEHIDILARDYMVEDEWPVIAEDFTQWVIEDNFCNGCPDWDQVGALMTKDVRPYEFMKLRLLNGGHSSISYISHLCGYSYVDDAMADPLIKTFVKQFFSETSKTLLPVPGMNTDEYQEKLVDRFGNPYIKDKLQRLAEDGSKKMANTMGESMIHLTEHGLPTFWMSLAIAAWMRYMTGEDERGDPILLKDPSQDKLQALAVKALEDPTNPAPADYIEFVFGKEFAAQEKIINEVKHHLINILQQGTKPYLQELVGKAILDPIAA